MLHILSGMNGLPWLVGSDFNEVLFDKEKEGGSQRIDSSMNDFHDALFNCALKDLRCSGRIYT